MTIVITGANRGIGRGLFERYTTRGDAVYGTARNPEKGQNWLALDVTKPESFSALQSELVKTPISLLVCNAGVYLDKGDSLEDGYPAVSWTETFNANVTGVFLTIQSLLPNLRMSAGAKITIISSTMATSTKAPGGSYIYRASKAAALNLGRNLAIDLKSDGIAVGIYHPGWVRTDMGTQAAAVSIEESSTGLVQRFDSLSLETTGCFEAFDGTPMDF